MSQKLMVLINILENIQSICNHNAIHGPKKIFEEEYEYTCIIEMD